MLMTAYHAAVGTCWKAAERHRLLRDWDSYSLLTTSIATSTNDR